MRYSPFQPLQLRRALRLAGQAYKVSPAYPTITCCPDGYVSEYRPSFWRIEEAHKVLSLRYTGWYGDRGLCEDLHKGLIVALPQGRWLAGYEHDGGCFFARQVFDSDIDAAHDANEQARIAAEKQADDAEMMRQLYKLQDDEGELLNMLRMYWQIRNFGKITSIDVRQEIRFHVEKIRAVREKLLEFSGVL